MWQLSQRLRERGLVWPLVLLVAILCGIWAFAAILSEVMEGDTAAFDSAILLALRQPGDLSVPIGPHAVQEFMRDLSGLGGVGILTLITLAATVFLAILRQYRSALFVTVSVALGSLISTGFKLAVGRPRPDLVPHGSFVNTASFPSGHSMMSAVVYLTLAVMLARTQSKLAVRFFLLSLAVALTFGVGVSRVYLGVHWPTDVLAGWVLGASWAVMCALVAAWMDGKGQIEHAAPAKDD